MKLLKPIVILLLGVGIGVAIASTMKNPFARPADDSDRDVKPSASASSVDKTAAPAKTTPPVVAPPLPKAVATAPVKVEAETPPASRPAPASAPAVAEVTNGVPALLARRPLKLGGGENAAEGVGLAPEVASKVWDASVYLRATLAGQKFEACGFFCRPGLIAANSSLLGIPRSKRAVPSGFTVISEDGKALRLAGYDPDSGLVYFRGTSSTNAILPLADDSNLRPQMAVWYPRFLVDHDTVNRSSFGVGEINGVRIDPATAQLNFVGIISDFKLDCAGTPCVDADGHLVALAGATPEETATGLAISCGDIRRSLKGRIGSTFVRKIADAADSYTFEVGVESIDPAEKIRSVNFYYWTVKVDSQGQSKSGSMTRLPLVRDSSTGKWRGAVASLKMPPGTKLWMQTGYYGAERDELLSEPLDCAVQLGVPDAPPPVPIVADADHAPPHARVEYIPQGGPTRSFFVGTQTTTTTVSYLITTDAGTTRIDYIYTNPPPAPPPDSPGWNLGYVTDPTSGHPSGQYELADRYGYSNYNYGGYGNYGYGYSGYRSYTNYSNYYQNVPNYTHYTPGRR